MPDLQSAAEARLASLSKGAAEWSDRGSAVRQAAREGFASGEWPAQVVEIALDNALLDAPAVLSDQFKNATWREHSTQRKKVLAILPGNVIGPTLATVYCAAAAGATLLLKSSSRELRLAEIVADQFSRLAHEFDSTIAAMRWSGGDEDFEAKIFRSVDRIVAFGSDETIADIKRRVPPTVDIVGYGYGYSVGFIANDADTAAATAAAQDVALFDQRGCLSPQTIYVEGDEAKAILFAHALRAELARLSDVIPRAQAGDAERAAAAEFVRRLRVRALPPVTHALDTVLVGPHASGVPEFVVGVEVFGEPVCAGFGRIVIVKPAPSAAAVTRALADYGVHLDTIGIAGSVPGPEAAFAGCTPARICRLGEMQRPPFGYRPRIADFMDGLAA